MNLLSNLFGMKQPITQDNIEKWAREKNIDMLIEALSHKSSDIRQVASFHINQLADRQLTQAVKPLIGLIMDSDWMVQSCAIEALGKIGDVRAKIPLEKALEKYVGYSYSDERILVIRALKQINDTEPSPTSSLDNKEYIIKCSPDILEPRKQESMFPIHVTLGIGANGIGISYISPASNKLGFEVSADIGLFHWMSDKNSKDSFTITYDNMDDLYYFLYYWEGNTQHKLGADDGSGLKGLVQTKGKYKNIEIGIIYRNKVKNTKIKVGFIAIDKKGNDDPSSTHELYNALINAKSHAS